ncbi:MAG TPA: ATP-binding protein [Opitutaceae bacterium]|jgi:PAS domain S-box-containing protein
MSAARAKKASRPARPKAKKRPKTLGASARRNLRRLGTTLSAYHEEIIAQNDQLIEAQTELERSRDRYALLYNEAPVGYLTLDVNGVIEGANATAIRLLGVGRDTILRRPLLVYVHEDDRPAFLNYLLVCRSTINQRRHWVEVRLRRASGGFAHVQLSSVGVAREIGKGIVYLTALTDVSGRIQFEIERRRSEENIVEAKRERATLQAANEAKDRFLAVLSHELRTPLAPAVLQLSVLARDDSIARATRDDLTFILECVRLEVRLIDDLLDLSRILNGKFELHPEHLDLRDIIHESLQVCSPDLTARELVVVPRLLSNPLRVFGDRIRMQQVFWNIIRNAIKFTPEGGTITIDGEAANEQAVVQVSDTGIGIDAEFLPRVFHAFDQGGRETTRRYGGLGLGMSLSRAVVVAHGGTIEAWSEGKGRGSTFTVHLPLDSTKEPEVPSPDRRAPDASEPGRRSLRILLVEDHSATRAAMMRLLRKLGHELDSVPNATEAEAAAQHKKFDLVISDLGLPDRDGYELMRELRRQYNLTGIAVSGYGMDKDMLRSRDAGFAMHLVKPITIDVLEKAIDRLARDPKFGQPPA